MSELFISILSMSITASYVIIFIMLIRLALKRAPKFISYALWGVAAFRLIIPFSFESMFSLMPRNTNAILVPRDIIYQQSPQINSGIEAVDSFVGRLLPVPATGVSVNPLQIYTEIGAYVWVLGIAALLVYSFGSIYILKKQLKSSDLIEENIYEAKNLKTPFVLGLIKPKIYLPAGINAEERNYILLHEQTHIHRKDHVIKILAFLILSIHWFNPFVWIAFILMSTDMELSCDERVLKEMDEDIKRPYANSLLSLATGRHILKSSPLAFSEGNVKGRIKNVMNYKKPTFWVLMIAIILLVGVTIGFSTNPVNNGVIMVNDVLYKEGSQRLNDLPSNVMEIGMLESILHNRNEIPGRNFQGAMLDEKYAGNLLYKSKDKNDELYLEDLSGYYIVFVNTEVSQSLSDRRPMIMVNGILYLDTGKNVPVEINDNAIIGEISSSIEQSEKPNKEGQTNFDSIGSKYASYEENIVVLINNKWVLFERE